ncbi:MAG TPA: ABC transporter permease [Candidatus Aminicenantes bacterium]|nr:ABC transporter permease [Candidatus Aminicenantes bacterium]HRY65446.1 ABC transporter permease [Candidatus Aminicenantes bacterium]HRZ72086.1 ABC transporter permease [Candidatus Aminicenantes bacterium]
MKGPTLGGIRSVVKKEFREIRRDSRSLGFMIFLPAFLLLMFGFALTLDVKHIALAVVDGDGSQASRELVDQFSTTEYFDLKAVLPMTTAIDPLMAREDIGAALVIPPRFAEDLLAGRSPSVQVLLDGSNAMTGATAGGYIAAILQTYSQKITLETLARRGLGGLAAPVAAEVRVWYNPELRSSNFLIPGLIAFILMVIVTISTASSIVREKERGTMDQLRISSLGSPDLIIGKMIPYALISLGSAHLVLLLSQVLFGVGIKGSYPLLLLAMVLFVCGALGQGLFISSITRTQQVAFLLALLTSMLPTFILSGFIFPVRNMPAVVQAITYFVPARYFLAALRAIVLKDAGLAAVWPQILFLAAFALLALGGSAARMGRGEKEPRPRRGRARA